MQKAWLHKRTNSLPLEKPEPYSKRKRRYDLRENASAADTIRSGMNLRTPGPLSLIQIGPAPAPLLFSGKSAPVQPQHAD